MDIRVKRIEENARAVDAMVTVAVAVAVAVGPLLTSRDPCKIPRSSRTSLG